MQDKGGLEIAEIEEQYSHHQFTAFATNKQILEAIKNTRPMTENESEIQISFDEAVRLSMRDTRHYVKRQLTWFRHNYIPNKIIEV